MITPTHDELLAVNDLDFHVVQWGNTGTPIVFLHGLTANAFCFQAFADELASDHHVFAYDLRGRGQSAKPDSGYSIPIHAADLVALLDALGLERPIIVGHSLGAAIAVYFAAHYPDRLSKLILLDGGAPVPWSSPEEQPFWLTAAISRLGTAVPSYDEYLQRLKTLPTLGPYWNRYTDLYFEHDVELQEDNSVVSRASRNAILEEGLRYGEAVLDQQWAHIQVPTLLLRAGKGMFAENDQLLPENLVKAMQEHIRGLRFANYPELNHYTIIFGVDPDPAQQIRHFVTS